MAATLVRSCDVCRVFLRRRERQRNLDDGVLLSGNHSPAAQFDEDLPWVHVEALTCPSGMGGETGEHTGNAAGDRHTVVGGNPFGKGRLGKIRGIECLQELQPGADVADVQIGGDELEGRVASSGADPRAVTSMIVAPASMAASELATASPRLLWAWKPTSSSRSSASAPIRWRTSAVV